MKVKLLVENDGEGFEIERIFEEELELRGAFGGGEPNHGGSGHGVTEEHGGSSAGEVNGLAASVGAGDQAPLGGGHGDGVLVPVEKKRSGDADGDLNEPNRHLAALPQNGVVIEAFDREATEGPPGEALDRLAADLGGATAVSEAGLEGVGGDGAGDDGEDEVTIVVRERKRRGERWGGGFGNVEVEVVVGGGAGVKEGVEDEGNAKEGH